MKKMSHRARLIRVILAALIFIMLFVLDHTLDIPLYIGLPLFAALYLFIGWDVALKAVKGLFSGSVLDENLLMFIATVGAFIIGNYPEAAAVMLFYQTGELFQSFAVGKSRASVAALMDMRPDRAVVVRNNAELTVDPDDVEIGETLVVRPGERVPLDGIVTDGATALDVSALTGESLPREVGVGDEALSGSINGGGLIRIRCEKKYGDSTVAKILDLVETASAKKARTENFISRFAAVYTPVVVICAVLLALLPPLFIGVTEAAVWSKWVYRALTFLVVSCPCALVISVPLTFFGAIGGASRMGVLVKGGSALETLEKTDIFVLDKTGTVTKGKFEVVAVTGSAPRERILAAAAIAESGSNHPIARALVAAAPGNTASGYEITEIAGYGVRAAKNDDIILAGNLKLMDKFSIPYIAAETHGGTVVHVARGGEYLGAVELGDAVKPDSVSAIADLKTDGARVVMLSGDGETAVKKVAEQAGIEEYRWSLLPADKVTETEKLLGRARKTAFVGDGINDAPVLATADLGVAMGGVGSDAAIEAADVVLMNDSLTALPRARKIAKKTMRVVRENVIFALAVKFAALVLSAIGLAGMWTAVFADVGVTVLAILNSMRMLAVKKQK